MDATRAHTVGTRRTPPIAPDKRELVDLDANLTKYLSVRSPTDRYASFDYCFNYFQERAESGKLAEIAEAPALEGACLQLGFYLASWGMYRGSTELLKRSFAYLAQVVRVIAAAPREIWSCDANDYSTSSCSLILEVRSGPRGISQGRH